MGFTGVDMSIKSTNNTSETGSSGNQRNQKRAKGWEESVDFDHLTQASERAARAFGQFISVASDITQSFGNNMGDLRKSSDESTPASPHSEVLRLAGEKLKEFRESAGHTVTSLADALQREGAYNAIVAAERGAKVFPREWLEPAYAIIGSGDPVSFYGNFDACYPEEVEPESVTGSSNVENFDSTQQERAKKLAALFEDDSELGNLTDEQFEVMLKFVDDNYRAAKLMLRPL